MVDWLTHNGCESPAGSKRDLVEVLRRRVDLLTGAERALMEMYLDSGQSFRRIARLTGSNASTVARRLHRIAQRLTDDTFFCCLRYRRRLRVRELAILRDYFVRGLSIGHICAARNVSRYCVRSAIRKARRLAALYRCEHLSKENCLCPSTPSRRSSTGPDPSASAS
jgi:DNA-directed RNA polymerase specialized sigma24 family protein